MSQSGAQLLIKSLETLKVKYFFGIPGAKIDAVFDAIQDSSIKLIVCRHEQNACFMAAAYGRLTGEPGVVLVTSGPGAGNMLTGLLTATTEGDPVVAIGGKVEKNAAMEAFGARLVVYGSDFDEAREEAERLADAEGLAMVPSFDPLLVRGVATYALELFNAV